MSLLEQFRVSSQLGTGNAAYVDELYELWLADANNVSADWQRYFDTLKGREAGDRAHGPVIAGFAEAAKLLGRPFRITGRVVYGQRLGTQLGVPTANVNLHRYRAPLAGVFAVVVDLPDGRVRGVANVGVRPTVGDLVKPVLEVHLLDWQGDLYGRRIQVEFKHKLREELRFASIEELAAQIYDDIAAARRFFAATEEPGQAAAL